MFEFSNEISDETKEKLFNLCSEYLGGKWSSISVDQLNVERVPGGFVNTKYLCKLPDDLNDVNNNNGEYNELKRIMVHYHGNEMKDIKSIVRMTKSEIEEALIAERLGYFGIGPRIYGVFDGGRLEEFFDCRTVKFIDSKNAALIENVARKLAKLHSTSMPLRKNEPFSDILNKIFSSLDSFHDLNDINEDRREDLRKLYQFPLKDEINWINKVSNNIKSPILFTHNDVNGNNILICNDGKIKFCDWDFSGYNYRGYDLGYFKTMKNVEIISEGFKPEMKLHEATEEDDFDEVFLRTYLEEFKMLTSDNKDFVDDGIIYNFDRLKMEMDFFTISASMFFIGFMFFALSKMPIEFINRPKEKIDESNPLAHWMTTYMVNKPKFMAKYKEFCQ